MGIERFISLGIPGPLEIYKNLVLKFLIKTLDFKFLLNLFEGMSKDRLDSEFAFKFSLELKEWCMQQPEVYSGVVFKITVEDCFFLEAWGCNFVGRLAYLSEVKEIWYTEVFKHTPKGAIIFVVMIVFLIMWKT